MKWIASFFFFAALPAMAERPSIVSLDYCADQFVLGLADPSQILALSKDSEKSFSHFRERAAGFPKVRAFAEDIIALNPDVVVRSWGGDARALSLYEKFGIRTIQVGYVADIQQAADETVRIAGLLDQEVKAGNLVSSMPKAHEGTGWTAFYLTPGGVTAGTGTMVDAIMRHAGVQNVVESAGWITVSLEDLVMNPPQLALTAFFDFDTDPTDNWSVSRHPAMTSVMHGARTIALDETRLTCPAWYAADEADDLAMRLSLLE